MGTLHGSQLFERETALIAREAQIGEREAAFFKQKTAYEIRIRDWSSDVCSSD
eukprot:COSAG02_NODE_5565_length_4226_cov_2.376545_1_plen_52_part_10